MESNRETVALAALAHPGRLAVFRLLARRAPGGVRPGEIIGALGLKPSTLSVHLATLERAGLIAGRRDGKSILYRVDLDQVGRLIHFLVADCCRGRPELCMPLAAQALHRLDKGEGPVSDPVFNVLFICVGNSARSIMAEAVLAELGRGKFRAFSAGTRPYSEMNPYALEVLASGGHDVSSLRAKHLAEFQGEDAPRLDFVFTLCDQAANEDCPPWPGQPVTAHWGMADPVKATGADAEKALAFKNTYAMLRRRLSAFVALPIDTLDRISLQRRLDAIGGGEAHAGAAAG